MRTIGLLGGMSWESTQLYYQLINQGIRKRKGGLHSARIVLVSVDFQEIDALLRLEKWHEAGTLLAENCRQIEAAGADFLLICTNTIHKVAERLQAAISIPLLHLADATAETLKRDNKKVIGLLGTRFTMEEDFYRRRLEHMHQLEVRIPPAADREFIHSVIFDELCQGRIVDDSRNRCMAIIKQLHDEGVEAIVLGCTELCLLVNQDDSPTPLFNTTEIHAAAAVDMALR